jgi:hypothetical protein
MVGTPLVGNEVAQLQGADGAGKPSSIPENVTADFIAGIGARVLGSAFSQASNTTLANVVGLADANLVPGGVYMISGWLHGSAAASGGIKVALVATGGLTVTSMTVTGWNYNGATLNAANTATALGSDFSNAAAAYTDFFFEGRITINAAGGLQVQAAQNTSNATATTITDATMEITRVA